MMVLAVNAGFSRSVFTKKLKELPLKLIMSGRSSSSGDENTISSTASMSGCDTIMENVKLRGLPVEREAPTHWSFTSRSACSIFNVSQLTAAHTGSLVRNATHATTPASQEHASVVVVCEYRPAKHCEGVTPQGL